MERIHKHRNFLRLLVHFRSDRRRRNQEVVKASRAEICAVCELVKNLLHNPTLNIKLDNTQKTALKRHQKLLKKLINRQVDSEHKRKILQKGAGAFLLPLVLSLVGPVVSKLLK